ncbi:Sigma factor SigB regulation protein RsbQ [compost metagenome]
MLKTVTVPTLVVVGENDELTPVPESEFIHQLIAHSTLVVIPQCGHLPPLEHPDITNQLLGDWLSATQ